MKRFLPRVSIACFRKVQELLAKFSQPIAAVYEKKQNRKIHQLRVARCSALLAAEASTMRQDSAVLLLLADPRQPQVRALLSADK